MTCSGSEHDEERTLETVPLELLPLHQGLEEDGSSWRATLPLADALLRRVADRAPMNAHPVSPGQQTPTHQPRRHKRLRH